MASDAMRHPRVLGKSAALRMPVVVGMVVILAALLGFFSLKSGPGAPRISFTLIEYGSTNAVGYFQPRVSEAIVAENVTELEFSSRSLPEAVMNVEPVRVVVARITIACEGASPVAYDSFSGPPEIFWRIKRQDGTRAVISYAGRLSGGVWLLAKGEKRIVEVRLPTDAAEWQVGFVGWKPSRRHRMAKLLEPLANKVPDWFWDILPATQRREVQEFWSPIFRRPMGPHADQ